MLYLVDASVFIFRAWFSVPVEVADRDGNPVNAVLGFARFLAELLEKESPRHIAVAFDESLGARLPQRDLSGLQGEPRAGARSS